MNVFVFDIETIPDFTLGRKRLGLSDDIDDAQVAAALLSQAKESTGQAFVKHYLQKVVAISVLLRQGDQIKVWSLGDPQSGEAELIQRFFNGIDKTTPNMVSWNGGGFDLPVLHYRALYHGITAATYWEGGEQNNQFKYNNYLNRYHSRHTDLMDVLSGYQAKSFAKLDDIAQMLGLPGKQGMAGSDVLHSYLRGEIEQIRAYCEGDVLNTYLIYLRFQKMRGALSDAQYEYEIEMTKNMLQQSPHRHHQEFLDAL